MPKREPSAAAEMRFAAEVRKAVDAAAVQIDRDRASASRIDDDLDRGIAFAYLDGGSLSDLGRRFDMSPETVRTRLAALGVRTRPVTFREPAFYRAKAERLRAKAEALEAVATIVQAGEVPPAALLARTTGGG